MTTILHVDNSPTVRAVLKTRLHRAVPGIEIVEARSVESARVALTLLRSRMYDLVVLDWSLPDGKASDLLHSLSGLRLVVVTADPSEVQGFIEVLDKSDPKWVDAVVGRIKR